MTSANARRLRRSARVPTSREAITKIELWAALAGRETEGVPLTSFAWRRSAAPKIYSWTAPPRLGATGGRLTERESQTLDIMRVAVDARTGRQAGSPTWRSSRKGWPRSTSGKEIYRWWRWHTRPAHAAPTEVESDNTFINVADGELAGIEGSTPMRHRRGSPGPDLHALCEESARGGVVVNARLSKGPGAKAPMPRRGGGGRRVATAGWTRPQVIPAPQIAAIRELPRPASVRARAQQCARAKSSGQRDQIDQSPQRTPSARSAERDHGNAPAMAVWPRA